LEFGVGGGWVDGFSKALENSNYLRDDVLDQSLLYLLNLLVLVTWRINCWVGEYMWLFYFLLILSGCVWTSRVRNGCAERVKFLFESIQKAEVHALLLFFLLRFVLQLLVLRIKFT
jgi:hypothetical protein